MKSNGFHMKLDVDLQHNQMHYVELFYRECNAYEILVIMFISLNIYHLMGLLYCTVM